MPRGSCRWTSRIAVVVLCGLGLAFRAEGQATFTNAAPIAINDFAAASPYPSSITVSGLSGTVTKVTMALKGLSVAHAADLDVLLVAPNGANLVVVSDVGGAGTIEVIDLTLDDAAAAALSNAAVPATGTYRPTDYGSGDTFPAPAPAPTAEAAPAGAATFASAFNGISPNGTWSLYVYDDAADGSGAIGGGWSLTITTLAAAPTTTTVGSSLNPSFTGSSVTFTATVTSGGNPVTTGAVTFKEGASTLASSIPLNASGQAAFSTTALSEGSHVIAAEYGGTASFGPSSGSVAQQVNDATVVNGSEFCNPGVLTINASGGGTPYPARLFVSGLSGAATAVTLALKGLTHATPDDVDVLLVGPTGATLVPMSDAGGATAVSNITLTLDDAAASQLPDAAALTGGSYRPTSHAPAADAFPAPAPAGPHAYAAPDGGATFASTFGGASPNGTWSVFVTADSAGGGGSVASAVCLAFTTSADTATVTTVTSSLNPSLTGDPVTFTAHVTKASDGSDVTSGSVTLKEGATLLGGPTAVDGTGRATFTTSALAEGSHAIAAHYSGVPGSFNLSSGSVTQRVDDATVASGNEFCNPGALAINASGGGAPYPARIFVGSLAGTVSGVTLTLAGLTHPSPDDVDVLLVGPTGATLVPMSDAGGASAVSNITLTLDDAAASLLPDASALAGGSYRPASHAPAADTFPAPAPAGPYSLAAPDGAATFASTFAGTDPGGTWSVYVASDGTGGAGEIASGVCLAFATTTPDLAIAKTHDRPLARGLLGVEYTLTVTNHGPGATVGTVTVTDTLPVGLGATSFAGDGWTCAPLPALECSRSDALAAGSSYPPVVLVADVAPDAPPTVTNVAVVTGGGSVASANDRAADEAAVASTPVPALGLAGAAALAALVAAAGAVAARRLGSA